MKKCLFALSYLVGLTWTASGQYVSMNPVPSRVLGQNNLTTSAVNLAEGREFNQPGSLALDTSVSPPILYVSDTGNNRILAWRNAAQFSTGSQADLVIGQR